jgi:hypothetical protein
MKIALLLLTINNGFIDNIKKYLNDDIKLYVHAKNINELDIFLKKHLIKNLIETNWGDISLVNASINLLEESFNECDYFYLISGDTYIINKPIIHDLSCFDFHQKNGEFIKTSQWWGLNKMDAKIIIDTRNKYNKYFSNKKLNGAFDEYYFLTVLTKEIENYKYLNTNIMFVKWLDNVITKHPFIFNKLTINNIYNSNNSLFIRKCYSGFEYKKHETKQLLYVFYIGTDTIQNDILKLNLNEIDYSVICSIEISLINNKILKNAFYIIPIIWKFFDNVKQSLLNEPFLCSWNMILFFSEKNNYEYIIKSNTHSKTSQIKDNFNNVAHFYENKNIYKEWFIKLKQQVVNDCNMFNQINKKEFLKKSNILLKQKKHSEIVISNNKIKSVSIMNERVESIITILNSVFYFIKIYNLKSIDGIYLFNFTDTCDMNTDIPVFCWSKPSNIKSFIFPDFNMHLFNNKKLKFKEKCNIEKNKKINKIFFTSSNETHKFNDEKNIIDIGKTTSPCYELCKYKYVLDVYPYSQSVRLIDLYLSNSFPLRVMFSDEYILFYELMFPKNESYIDISCETYFFNKIEDKKITNIKNEIIKQYNYYNNHSNEYDKIVNLNEKKIHFFTMEHIYYYVYQALKYYKKLLLEED